MSFCNIEECKNHISAKGYCSKHYYRFKKYGDPNIVAFQIGQTAICIVKDCNKQSNAKGLCPKHYYRKKTYGDPNVVRFPWKEDRECSIDGCSKEHEAKGYCRQHYQISRKFKIDPKEYNDKLIKQNKLCAICNNSCTQKEMLSLDHDHDSGKIRGLLCSSCNLALGGFKDNPLLLKNAIKYLKKWGKI